MQAVTEENEGNSHSGSMQAAGAAMAAAALLAACGGGDAPPAAMLDGRAAVSRPELLEVQGSDTRHALAAPTPDALMDWAERQFPHLFAPSASQRVADGLVYRFYSGTGNYLGVRDGQVLLLGPATGGQLVHAGQLGDFVDALVPQDRVDNDEDAARFLHHAAFGASDSDIEAVRQKGYAGWLDDQLSMPMGQSKWDWLASQGYTQVNDRQYFFSDYYYQFAIWRDLMSAPDMVRQRWVLALSELFVVSVPSVTGVQPWTGLGGAHFWDTMAGHGFGNFRDLLQAVTLHPVMGAFLNTRGNRKEDPATGRVPDENYAREVMQLFTIGLHQLNLDGTPRLGANGQPIDSYGQSDVTQLARVFTGYDLDLRGVGNFNDPSPPHYSVWYPEYVQRPMQFFPERHSTLEARFLGVHVPAGTPGPEALRIALDTLFNHPNTGPFFARQMIQRLVASNPAPDYVARVAAKFNDNGAGVRGDLKAVLRAILLDKAARGPSGLYSRTFGKLREPILRITNWARAFKVRSLANTWKFSVGSWDTEADLQQYPLAAPSVFNFFRPGYVPPSTEMATQGATAPEFQLVSESSVSAYINYLQNIIYQGAWIGNPGEAGFPRDNLGVTYVPDIVPDYSAEFALVGNTLLLVQRLNILLTGGQLSPATQDFIVNALRIDRIRADSPDEFKRIHVARAVLFVMASAEYLIQK